MTTILEIDLGPLLPAFPEFIAGIVLFIIIWYVLAKKVVPSFEATYAERAAEIQGGDRSMIPAAQTYASFQAESYRELREANGQGFHGERHTYAQERYSELTGAPAPVAAAWGREERFERLAEHLGVSIGEAKAIDQDAREQVAQELGHGRCEVTNAYLG